MIATTRGIPPVAALALLAASVAAQDPPPPRPEDEETKSLRQELELLYQESVVGGQELAASPRFQGLSSKGEKTLERLHDILMDIGSPESQKIAAVRVLEAWRREESVYPLMLTMNDPAEDYRVRAEILERVGNFEDDRVVIPLVQTLKGKETRLHGPAARSLSRFGENERAQRNFRTLVVSPDPSTRGWTARAIGWSGWKDGGEILLAAAARETDPTALGRILLGLADLRVPEGVDRAVAALGSAGEEARALAAEALGTYGSMAREKGLDPLLAVVENDSETEGVRGVAAGEIPDIAPDSDDAAKRLLSRMGHPSDPLNLAIKIALRRMASPWLVEALIEILADPKESERRRFGAWQVLRAISGRDMPQEAAKWAEWWKSHGASFDFPNRASAGGKNGR